MKRLIAIGCMLLGMFLSGMAQKTPSKADEKNAAVLQKKADKDKKDAKKKADMDAKSAKIKAEKDAKEAAKKTNQTAKSTGTNKDGTPDMRLKKNKEAAKSVQSPAKTVDKVVGKDDKGRTIYEGPKGGKYYINKNGNKEYIKKG